MTYRIRLSQRALFRSYAALDFNGQTDGGSCGRLSAAAPLLPDHLFRVVTPVLNARPMTCLQPTGNTCTLPV